ncbi:TRAP transporter large permease subunit [Chloroflexota bacterium]
MVSRIFGRLENAISLASRGAGSVGASIIAVMMFLTAVDVILRYFFNRPIIGSFELTEYLMVSAISFTLAYCAILKGHVRVDVIISLLPQGVQLVIRSIVTILALGLFSLVTWQSAIQAGIIQASGAYSSVLRIPTYPFVWVLFVGSALLSLVFLRDLRESVARAVKGSRWAWIWILVGGGGVLWLSVAIIWGQGLPRIEPATTGLVGVGVLIILLLSGMEIGVVIAVIGFLGMAYLSTGEAALGLLRQVPYSSIASYNMSIVPLFILMGAFCFHSGLSADLYWTAYRWLGRLPGGLAMATVVACGCFAAVSGSSLATAATLGTVALPEMKRYKYDDKLATGAIAAGGTIGILIPPSIVLVIYAILTDESVGKLFMAGFIPGILEAVFYMVTIYILCKRNPLLGPVGEKISLKEKVYSLKDTWGVLILFGLVMGGIYTGIFSPTEAAGIGAMGAFLFAIVKRKLTWKNFTSSIMETGKTTAMALLILISAMIFGYFLAVTRLPFTLADFASSIPVNRYFILIAILCVYFFLGCIMASLAMILLTVPIFFPVIVALGFDPIWFGILIVRVCEVGVITPPVGMNVYIIYGVAKDVPLYTIFRGIIPFLIADFCHIAMLIAVPQVSLFLPGLIE